MNIFGARGRITDMDDVLQTISRLEKQHDSTVQLFRADRIFGREHLQAAAEMADRSWTGGIARARTLGMEIMLYAAAERQISGAIEKLGIEDGMTEIATVVIGNIEPDTILDALDLQRADDVLEPEGKDHSIFDISQDEMNMVSIPELVLERVALSEIDR